MSSRNTVLRGSGGEEYVHHWWSMFDSEHLLQPERTRFRPYNTSAVLLMYWIYSFLYALALTISLPYWLIGMARAGKYRAGLKERFGAVPSRLKLPEKGKSSIWIHAVSVGEVLAVAGLIETLKAEFP